MWAPRARSTALDSSDCTMTAYRLPCCSLPRAPQSESMDVTTHEARPSPRAPCGFPARSASSCISASDSMRICSRRRSRTASTSAWRMASDALDPSAISSARARSERSSVRKLSTAIRRSYGPRCKTFSTSAPRCGSDGDHAATSKPARMALGISDQETTETSRETSPRRTSCYSTRTVRAALQPAQVADGGRQDPLAHGHLMRQTRRQLPPLHHRWRTSVRSRGTGGGWETGMQEPQQRSLTGVQETTGWWARGDLNPHVLANTGT